MVNVKQVFQWLYILFPSLNNEKYKDRPENRRGETGNQATQVFSLRLRKIELSKMLYECRFPETDNMNWQNGPKSSHAMRRSTSQKSVLIFFRFFFYSKGDGTPDKKSCQNDWSIRVSIIVGSEGKETSKILILDNSSN